LAAKLYEGAKIYVPKIGENSVAVQSLSTTDQQTLINVNKASIDALDGLPGVGPATATKIIDNRPYKKPNDLLDKKVVSGKVFDQIKDKISTF
jgi:competence protein ComEA